MIQACREYGSPEPELRYEDSGFWVEFSGKTPDMILAALRQDPLLSMPEIASWIGKSESAVERAIKRLREAGKLERIGPAKGDKWNVLDDN
jgi:ATP-dependent DNA helicase RecG